MTRLTQGSPAPPFTLPDQDGELVSLADYADRMAVVYFYPADDTPGCTKEACQFNDNLEAFDRADMAVLGVSPDDAVSHVRFREKFNLHFPLLSDSDHAVMTAYGAWGEKSLYGRTVTGVIRSTFLVGPDAVIQRAWYNVRSNGHAAKVLAEMGA